jgi:hypothetical protein
VQQRKELEKAAIEAFLALLVPPRYSYQLVISMLDALHRTLSTQH